MVHRVLVVGAGLTGLCTAVVLAQRGLASVVLEAHPARSLRTATVAGQDYFLVDGKVCRVSGTCTHLGGVVSWNDAERTWDCPLPGSRFTHDGHLIEGPVTADLAPAPDSSRGDRHTDGRA